MESTNKNETTQSADKHEGLSQLYEERLAVTQFWFSYWKSMLKGAIRLLTGGSEVA